MPCFFELPLTEEAVRFFVDQGYLVVRNVVGVDDRQEILADADRFGRGEYKTVSPSSRASDSATGASARPILAVHFPHWVSPIIQRMVRHPEVTGVVQRIAAAHLPYWDGRAKCMQSMLFVKPPGLPGQAWHQDERYIPTRDRSLVGAWIAVEEATTENGCLSVLPASHRQGYLWPTRDHGRPEEFDFADESYGFDGSGEVFVEVEAGSVVFLNGYLLHRSARNRSNRSRRALVNHYCNAYSLLPWPMPPLEIQSSQIGSLDYRGVVPIGEDPYAWKGYTATPDLVFLRRYGT